MPYCSLEEEFILKFRKQLEVQSSKHEIPALQYDPQGVDFSVADGKEINRLIKYVINLFFLGREHSKFANKYHKYNPFTFF